MNNPTWPLWNNLQLDPTAGQSLQKQLFDQLQSAIIDGRLRPNSRLPSSRTLAEILSVSRITVSTVYERLQAEGYLQTRRGVGTLVSTELPDSYLKVGQSTPASKSEHKPLPLLSKRGQQLTQITFSAAQTRLLPR